MEKSVNNIKTTKTRDELITDFGKATLTDRYLLPDESYQDLFGRVSSYYGADAAHAQRIYDYMSQHWFMAATPILSNGGANRGLPISCFLNETDDKMTAIRDLWSENVDLASKGGGIGSFYGNVRSIGENVGNVGKTSGVIPFIKVQDSMTLAVSQGGLRKGSSAAYLPVWHPEVEEFIEIRRPTGGDPNRKCLNIHHGVVIDDAFMQAVESGADYDLKSPHDGSVIRSVSARSLWIRILTARLETGEPFLLFSDTVKRARPDIYKRLGLDVKTSNLCVAGDTLLKTDKGDFPIESLAGSVCNVWNGEEFTEATVAQTSNGAALLTVYFSDGEEIKATYQHKWYTWNAETHQETEKRTNELCVGDLIRFKCPNDITRIVRVTGVNDFGDYGPTYCAHEPKRHRIMLEGILTGNCNEIVLTTGPDHTGNERTAVCNLSSINLETWDEWHDNPQFIEDIMRFLDNVLQDFIERAPDTMARAKYAAMRERSVGLGVMGFHSFLQARGIPYESVMAKVWNKRIFKHIREQADAASCVIAEEKGSCPDAIEARINRPERFTHKLAVAPTASISIIAGTTSPGIDPITANVYLQKTLSGSFSVRNRHLAAVLEKYGRNDDATWSDITVSKGSVQHLDFLTQQERDVFKTAFEIDQRWVIEHAADRAGFICQGASNNLWLPADIHKRDLHEIHYQAWKKGVKGLYYCRSLSIQRADTVSKPAGVAADNVVPQTEPKYDECIACQ